jgi:glycosyltransferase involved in cell wall biosynthesis
LQITDIQDAPSGVHQTKCCTWSWRPPGVNKKLLVSSIRYQGILIFLEAGLELFMSNNRKISFFISSLGGGGAEGVCVNIANGLAEKGWEINLVVLNLEDPVYLDRLSDRVKLVVLGVSRVRYAFIPLCKYILKYNPRKFLVFNYLLTVQLVFSRKLLFKDFLIIARNINTFSQNLNISGEGWQRKVVFRIVSLVYDKVNHVINQCKGMEQDLLERFPSLRGKTSVIYNPVSKEVQNVAEATDLNKVEKGNFFLCVGRLESQKAFHYAIKAFSLILKENPGLRLKIVGAGSLGFELKEQARSLNIVDKVDFEGFQKNIVPYYLRARATVLTSLYEGFPNVLVESITLGTPVVAFDCQSGPDEIINKENGLLVKYKSLEDLAISMASILNKRWDPEIVSSSLSNMKTSVVYERYESSILGVDAK